MLINHAVVIQSPVLFDRIHEIRVLVHERHIISPAQYRFSGVVTLVLVIKQRDDLHQFLVQFARDKLGITYALAHNGVLWNDKELRIAENLPLTSVETDSYIAVQLLEQQKALDFDSLKAMAEKVEGSFVFTVLDKDNAIWFIVGDIPDDIHLICEKGTINPKNVIGILTAGLKKGSAIKIEVEGANEKESGAKIMEFLEGLTD